MLFSPKKLLTGAIALLSVTSSVAADDCSSGPWTDVLSIGADSGAAWCATKYKSGIVITGVEVWADKNRVQGIQFYYSDGTDSGLFGRQNGDKHNRLNWDPAHEQLQQVKLWGNGDGKALGRVFIHTSKGNELDVGKDTNGQKTYEITVNSGILLGAFGGQGDNIDRLGLLFLKSKIKSISQTDVKFADTPDALNSKQQGLEEVTIDYADHTNNNKDANETFTFSKQDTRTATKTYTTTVTNTFGFEYDFELSGEIMGIGAKDTFKLSYQYQNQKSDQSSTSNAVALTYSIATNLKPGQTTYCRSQAMSGTYKGDYSATTNLVLQDGSTFSFSSGGTLNQVAWSQAQSSCQDKPFTSKVRRATKFIA